MKGLLRRLRYISQIFDEKEQEIQIGYPTDVKHVAHIGWDGPSAVKPSWMNEFKSPPNYSFDDAKADFSVYSSLSGTNHGDEKPKHRPRRASSAANSPKNSPGRRGGDGLKSGKRQRGLNTGIDSSRETGTRRSRGKNSKESPKTKENNSSAEITLPTDPLEKSESKAAKNNYARHLSSVLEAYEDNLV